VARRTLRFSSFNFLLQAEDCIRDRNVTGVQTCALPILTITGEPLKDYYAVADQTYSGKMLSQNYGGGTANIEFSALTGFSLSLLTPQMTSPYTMLVSKMT